MDATARDRAEIERQLDAVAGLFTSMEDDHRRGQGAALLWVLGELEQAPITGQPTLVDRAAVLDEYARAGQVRLNLAHPNHHYAVGVHQALHWLTDPTAPDLVDVTT